MLKLKIKFKELLFTAFYAGYFPIAPGTAGTFVAMMLYIAENLILSDVSPMHLNIINLVIVLVLIYPSVKLGDFAESFFQSKDPQQVVIDEVMGYWVGILFIPFSITSAILAFVFFRIFDIIKPFPARRFESFKGGLGIMIDDYIAGIYTCIVMHLIIYFIESYQIVFI